TEFKPVRVTSSLSNSNSNSKVQVNQLMKMELFGSLVKEEKKVEIKPVEDAVETKLNLKLRGIYASDEPKKANAIIEDGRGKQAVYFLDEKLDVGGRVYLRQVYVDRIILDNNGSDEKLTLDTQELPNMGLRPGGKRDSRKKRNEDDSDARKKVTDKRGNQRISRQLNEYKDKFQKDPSSVADVINGRPHFVDGELRGFSISPGKDKRLFQELGLKRGDVVTSINGVALNNMQDAMTLMNDVQSLTEVSVDIQRGNESLSLLLNLNEKVGR
ncbi:MAG: type II secretion system protein GspC, partial [Kangiellaceae bacterium]|nr:type II secretion system protein GspC [Kangiellaceae bacterium]